MLLFNSNHWSTSPVGRANALKSRYLSIQSFPSNVFFANGNVLRKQKRGRGTNLKPTPNKVITLPGLVVMGRDSRSEVRRFESQHRILDGHFLHIFVVKIVMMFV